jgi:protoporphyrinogen/coproporphyrinogen III oxidase
VAASATAAPPQRIAILGAGITGLSAAYHLLAIPSNNPPKVTIYEKSSRVGGWVQSKYVDVSDGSGQVLFESGARNVRPAVPVGLATISMWEQLGLGPNMIVTPKNSVAAKKRWLYYPDHLVELPGPGRGVLKNLWSLLTEPAFKGYLGDLAYEMSVPPRGNEVEDESVGAFVTRRLRGNRQLVDKVASAVLHGIYAGDAWQLSARSVLGDAWWAEKKGGSVTRGMMVLGREGWMRRARADLLAWLTQTGRPSAETMLKVANASTVTLDGGLDMMAVTLRKALEQFGGVQFKMETEINSIATTEDGEAIELTTAEDETPERFDQIISTIPSKTLSYVTTSEANPESLSTLARTPAVTVNVVNLFYNEPDLLPIQGFGYLIPQATPFDQNPELALGVVFDSDVVPLGQDRLQILDTSKPEQPRGTKVTVMLGGHWYNSLDSIPDEDLALQHAKNILKRHMKITAEPAAHLVTQQKDCIPQYTVGHVTRLQTAHNELLRRFKGHLKVAGCSYSGVGLNDCVVNGIEIAGMAAGGKDNWGNLTGLEWAAENQDVDYVQAPIYLAKEKGLDVVALGRNIPGVKAEKGNPDGR